MFRIIVENEFTAFHQIMLPDGSREELHEHNWKVYSTVRCEKLNRMDLAIDFHVLRKMVDNITSKLSGNQLGNHDYFEKHNPSAENVAFYIYGELKSKLGGAGHLESVRVMEERGCWAEYCE